MTDTLPSCEEICTAIRPVLDIAIAAIADGVDHVREYADWQDEGIDRQLAPAIVRHKVKLRLRKAGQHVEEEELIDGADDSQPALTVAPVPFEAIMLPNNGLLLETAAYLVRILKSDLGMLPPPGPSRRRRQFYAQQPFLPFNPPVATPVTGGGSADAVFTLMTNLVLHWTVDDEYKLTKINLALPKGGGNTRASVEWHWDEVIWRPAPAFAPVAAVEAPADELNITIDRATGTQASGGSDE